MEHEAEYSAFVAERWSPLVRTAVFLGASAHEAEDLVQATLLLCYRKWDRVRAADDRDGYVYRMLLNVLRSDRRSAWWRHRSPHPVGSAREATVGDAAEATAIADAVQRDGVPGHCRSRASPDAAGHRLRLQPQPVRRRMRCQRPALHRLHLRYAGSPPTSSAPRFSSGAATG